MIYIKIAFKEDLTNWYIYLYNGEDTCKVIAANGEKWGKISTDYIGKEVSLVNDIFWSKKYHSLWTVDILTESEIFLEAL